MLHFEHINILGINFTKITENQLIKSLIDDHKHKKNRFIVTANPEIVLAARKNKEYQKIINHADYVTADGIGIIKGANILNTPLPERVTGFDTMLKLLNYSNKNKCKVYFLGAKETIIKDTIINVQKDYPDIIISGYHNGYFKNPDPIIKDIKQKQPDFIFVALGFPKQDYFIEKYREISNSIWMGVGGSFDILAGNINRAPEFWINHHIEWLYRLIQEPKRFIRMLALPKYLLLIYKEKFKQKK
nr:WecB/TagA/CpsF family glycosyltransferase [uncultured Ligilactobacillus sp.]